MPDMDVVILTKRLDDPGGSEISSLQLEKYFSPSVTYFGFGASDTDVQNRTTRPKHHINTIFPGDLEKIGELWLDNRQFLSAIRDADPDIIFSHHWLSLLGAYLGVRLSVPHVVFLHDLYMKPSSASIVERSEIGIEWMRELMEDTLLKYAYEKASVLIANSHYTKSVYENMDIDIPISVMYPLVDPNEYVVEPVGDEILYVTPLYRKGIDVMLSVAEKMPNEDFLIVGPKQPDNTYRDRISSLSNVRYEGYHHDMKQVYRRTKLVLMPSRAESFGRVSVEAGFSGIPTVAADTGGLSESVGVADCLVSGYDPDDYVTTIRTILDNYEYYSEQARNQAMKLSAPKQVERLQAILQNHLPSQFPVQQLFHS